MDLLEHAQTLKKQGNTEFGQGRWEMALETYREGLKELPVRRRSVKGKEKALPPREDGDEGASPSADEDADEEAETEELCELRAILAANVAACLLKLNRWKDAVKACDDALEDKADYAKAIQRRALANEAIGSWGSLTASLEDFNKLTTLPGNTPLLAQQIKQAQARLPGKIEVQQAKEKEEVVGKLKDLGNMVLGKFGLSTDNFKLQEQPGGGYGISFQR
ncbi:Cytochrome c oxidase subunit 1 [Rhodotorula kratochvilovae]